MNWSKVIGDLESAGMTQQEIAEAAKCSQPYVSQLKGGRRKGVSFSVGSALTALHAARVVNVVKGRSKDRVGYRAP